MAPRLSYDKIKIHRRLVTSPDVNFNRLGERSAAMLVVKSIRRGVRFVCDPVPGLVSMSWGSAEGCARRLQALDFVPVERATDGAES